ncbi:MAG: PilZ domain-containing protein [Oleiphilaceae bacterium]|nr:PilZ domain-containing protein [Oleiphilaceae bacterium]
MSSVNDHARSFIRHPLDMPIEVLEGRGGRHNGETLNLSLGGVAFQSHQPHTPGQDVRVRISCCDPPAEVAGHVVWCEPDGALFDVGVAFYDPGDAYKMRMVEQACHIQQYRLDRVIEEGRYLTLDEAAREWIPRYARRFTEKLPGNNTTSKTDSSREG